MYKALKMGNEEKIPKKLDATKKSQEAKKCSVFKTVQTLRKVREAAILFAAGPEEPDVMSYHSSEKWAELRRIASDIVTNKMKVLADNRHAELAAEEQDAEELAAKKLAAKKQRTSVRPQLAR